MPIRGQMPDPANLPEGCAFHPRCPYADEACRTCHPELKEVDSGHFVRCLHAGKGVPLYFRMWTKTSGPTTRGRTCPTRATTTWTG